MVVLLAPRLSGLVRRVISSLPTDDLLLLGSTDCGCGVNSDETRVAVVRAYVWPQQPGYFYSLLARLFGVCVLVSRGQQTTRPCWGSG